jgi:transposase
MIGGGRAQVRRSLYMATLVATKHNRLIPSHDRQLIDCGKAKMTAIIACMRKLLLILNAMIKNQTPWKEAVAS